MKNIQKTAKISLIALLFAAAGCGGDDPVDTISQTPDTQNGPTMQVKEISSNGAHTLAIKPDGTLWVWGANTTGGFANGTADGSDLSVPVQIGIDSDWKYVYASNTSFAIKEDGTLWGWGRNGDGQLGIGNQVNTYTVTQIGTDHDWKTVAPGVNMTIAQKTDGTLWGWGAGVSLGMGQAFALANPDVVSPVMISTETDWKQFSANLHVLAVKNNGELWAWGNDIMDVFGNPGQLITFDKVRVGTDTDWSQVATGEAMSMGIKTDGRLFSWGTYALGRSGSGDIPGQVGTDTNWTSVSIGYLSAVGLRSDGAIWAWGIKVNGAGSNAVSDPLPIQPTTQTGWAKVTMGGGIAFAVKPDQTLYGWGSRYTLFGYPNERSADAPVEMNWPQ